MTSIQIGFPHPLAWKLHAGDVRTLLDKELSESGSGPHSRTALLAREFFSLWYWHCRYLWDTSCWCWSTHRNRLRLYFLLEGETCWWSERTRCRFCHQILPLKKLAGISIWYIRTYYFFTSPSATKTFYHNRVSLCPNHGLPWNKHTLLLWWVKTTISQYSWWW